jgi:histidinol-phosphatase (PHP family)
MRVDLHNHTTLCNHAVGTTEEYIKKAIDLGIDIYGFSDHAPCKNKFDPKYRMDINSKKSYENDILFLKDKYKKDIKILLGYEVDFVEGDYIYDEILNGKNIDYLIGSVHFIPQFDSKYSLFNSNFWGFDNPEFIDQYQSKDITKIWEDYFQAVYCMVKSNKFDIVGHLDLIKVFGFFPKKDIKSIAYKTLKEIKKSNMVLEINPAGLRKTVKEQYPSKQLLELAYELDIPITFGSDAHKLDDIGFKYDEVVALAKNVGYNKCVTFESRCKQLVIF